MVIFFVLHLIQNLSFEKNKTTISTVIFETGDISQTLRLAVFMLVLGKDSLQPIEFTSSFIHS